MLTPGGPAQLIYYPSDFEVVRQGSHVRCAVTGDPIPLEALTYWSAEHQEAYRGAAEATAAITAGGAAKLPK
jgi:hypothetical protein